MRRARRGGAGSAAVITSRLRGWSGVAVVGVQGGIRGGGLRRWFYGALPPATLARATAAGRWLGDAAGGGGDPDGCRSLICSGAVMLGGGQWVICASSFRWLTLPFWGRRRTTHRWFYGRWRSPLPPRRTTGGRWRGGLPYCLIKVADRGFLLCKYGDLPEAGPS
jgi:hypothetical protein